MSDITNNLFYSCNSNLYGVDIETGFEYRSHVSDGLIVTNTTDEFVFYFNPQITDSKSNPILLKTESNIFYESVERVVVSKYKN